MKQPYEVLFIKDDVVIWETEAWIMAEDYVQAKLLALQQNYVDGENDYSEEVTVLCRPFC